MQMEIRLIESSDVGRRQCDECGAVPVVDMDAWWYCRVHARQAVMGRVNDLLTEAERDGDGDHD